eukprot:15482751-Alexandrium_andersonii.AAC.1
MQFGCLFRPALHDAAPGGNRRFWAPSGAFRRHPWAFLGALRRFQPPSGAFCRRPKAPKGG